MFGFQKYPKKVYFHCRRVPKSKIPANIDTWLYDAFNTKDKMLQEFLISGELNHPDDESHEKLIYKPKFNSFPLEIAMLWCIMVMCIGFYVASTQ